MAEPHDGNEEATLEWVALGELTSRPMWTATTSGCQWWSTASPRPFHGVMPYDRDRMTKWTFCRSPAPCGPRAPHGYEHGRGVHRA
jgi:8-oxo-dGTP diphosphatase